MTTQAQWIRARHAPRCCSDCGRLAALCEGPRTRIEALELAILKGLGTRAVLEKRFDDMCASGLLVPYSFDD
jgi:hypothetical protein